MRLTKQTSYALRILTHCAIQPETRVKAADIAKAYNITEFNVLKIIPLLVHGGFVKTTRGRRGGLRLAQPAADIRIGDVVRLTEQTHIQADCFGQGEKDGEKACPILPAAPINRIFGSAVHAFIEVLDQHTLQDLVAARPRQRTRSAGERAAAFDLAGLSALAPAD